MGLFGDNKKERPAKVKTKIVKCSSCGGSGTQNKYSRTSSSFPTEEPEKIGTERCSTCRGSGRETTKTYY